MSSICPHAGCTPARTVGMAGDHVIVLRYAGYEETELAAFHPSIAFVDDAHRVRAITHAPTTGISLLRD